LRVPPLRRLRASKLNIGAVRRKRDVQDGVVRASLQVLHQHVRLIAMITLAVTAAFALLSPPLYQASMLIHVGKANPADAMPDIRQTATAELELLRSRTVLAPAVERLKLYIDARPDYFPLFGTLLRDARPAQLSEPGLFGMGGHVWGSERIDVSLFNVPPVMYQREFVITSIDDERFSVFDATRNTIFHGRVGPVMTASTPDGVIELRVARLSGRPGARFLVSRSSAMVSTKKLQDELMIAERGELPGVIEARLEGRSAELVSAVLEEIGQQYVAQNLARQNGEAEQSPAFLEQSPKLKTRLGQVIGEAVHPERVQVIATGALFGLLLGICAAFAHHHLAGGALEPNRIEKLLGARIVFADIPHSEAQSLLGKRGATSARQPLLALAWPTDGAIESLRSFRASLRFSMPQFCNNILMFAGPTAGLGKSFITANFAAVMAAAGKRVLLVDADVRNGRLHHLFGAQRRSGLCEAINGAIPFIHAIRRDVLPNLDFIPTGCMPKGQPDFLMHPDVGGLLKSVSGDYDLVLVDSPPILALADSQVIGSHAGAVFLVVRAGVSTEREISESIERLHRAGVAPFGILFNDVMPRASGEGSRDAGNAIGRLEFTG
jgi:capsular exopolysaccharide synthesis family protein